MTSDRLQAPQARTISTASQNLYPTYLCFLQMMRKTAELPWPTPSQVSWAELLAVVGKATDRPEIMTHQDA